MKTRKLISILVAAVIVLIPLMSASALAATDETPLISESPKNYCWPEGSLAAYTCECENDADHSKFVYEWHIVYEGKDYTYNAEMTDPWCEFFDKSNSGANVNMIFFDGIKPGLNGAEIYCTVTCGGTTVSSPSAIITVGDPIMFLPAEISAPTFVSCAQGDDITLEVSGKSNVAETNDSVTYNWYQTDTGKIMDIILIGGKTGDTENNPAFKPNTSEIGTFYYVCGIFDGEKNAPDMCNRSYTNVITVEVTEKIENISIELTSAPAKTEYTAGETLDLTGLQVRVVRSDGYLDLTDGSGVTVTPEKLEETGEQTVTVTYMELSTEFKVNVIPVGDTQTETETEESETVPATETEDTAASDTEADTSQDTEGASETADEGSYANAEVTDKNEEKDTQKLIAGMSPVVFILAIVAIVLLVVLIAVIVILILTLTKKAGR